MAGRASKLKRREVLGKLGNFAFLFGQRAFLIPDIVKAERRGERMGNLLYRLDRKHRERAISNLKMAFPEWPPERHIEVAQATFRHFGVVTADFLRSPIRTNEEVISSTEGSTEEAYAKIREIDRGCLAFTAHFGNWERYAQWSTALGHQLSVVARDADDGELQNRVLEIRQKTGIEVLSRGNSARQIIGVLRNKGAVALLADQNSSEGFVPFFGKPAGTVLGPGVLALRTGAPILPAFCVRIGPGRYRSIILDLIQPGPQTEPLDIMAELHRILEEQVRLYPEQYLWLHDRWKTARQRGML